MKSILYNNKEGMTITDFISAEFEIGKEPEKIQLRRLDVLHHSDHELGLLITKIARYPLAPR